MCYTGNQQGRTRVRQGFAATQPRPRRQGGSHVRDQDAAAHAEVKQDGHRRVRQDPRLGTTPGPRRGGSFLRLFPVLFCSNGASSSRVRQFFIYNAGAMVHATIPRIVIALTKIQKILTIVFRFIKLSLRGSGATAAISSHKISSSLKSLQCGFDFLIS